MEFATLGMATLVHPPLHHPANDSVDPRAFFGDREMKHTHHANRTCRHEQIPNPTTNPPQLFGISPTRLPQNADDDGSCMGASSHEGWGQR